MPNRLTLSLLVLSIFASLVGCGSDPGVANAFDPIVPSCDACANPTGPTTSSGTTTAPSSGTTTAPSSTSSGTSSSAQGTSTATTTASTTAGVGGAGGSGPTTATTTTAGAGGTTIEADGGAAGAPGTGGSAGATQVDSGAPTPEAGSDAAVWADAKDGTIASEASTGPDAGTTIDSGTTPPPDTGTTKMKPALYLIFDQTYWSLAKDFPQNPGKIGWPIFAGGVKQFAASRPDAYAAVQYEPIKKPGSNSANPANYSPPAVGFGLLTDGAHIDAISASIDAQPATSPNTQDCQLGAATQAALDYIAASAPADTSARIVLLTRFGTSSMPTAIRDSKTVKLFVISVHSPYDGAVNQLAMTQGPQAPLWAESAADVATALGQIVEWQPPVAAP